MNHALLSHIFPINRPNSLHTLINLSPLSFIPVTLSSPLIFRSPNKITLSSALKLLNHSLNSSQKSSLFYSLVSLPGPYVPTKTHLLYPKVILIHISLDNPSFHFITIKFLSYHQTYPSLSLPFQLFLSQRKHIQSFTFKHSTNFFHLSLYTTSMQIQRTTSVFGVKNLEDDDDFQPPSP